MSNYLKKRESYLGRCLTRKDFSEEGRRYYSRAYIKPIREYANSKLRRHKGEVGNNGWFKRFVDVWWIAF